jgi:hypothetical protein
LSPAVTPGINQLPADVQGGTELVSASDQTLSGADAILEAFEFILIGFNIHDFDR